MAKKKKKGGADDGLSDAQRDAQSADAKAAKQRAEGQDKAMTAAGEFLDDVMEGFAEIYRITVGVVTDTSRCVKSTVRPVKEYLIGSRTTTEVVDQDIHTAVSDGQTFDMT